MVWVAELDGRVAAAMAAFPVDEAVPRSARASYASPCAPRRRGAGRARCRCFWAGGRAAPAPRPRAPSTWTRSPPTRPSGAAAPPARCSPRPSARRAARGLPAVALDTTVGNDSARALYAREGFEEVAYRPAGRGLPGFVALVKPLR